jgi:hypothetical protein
MASSPSTAPHPPFQNCFFVSNISFRYGISPKDIGRLEVGTETVIDKVERAAT